MNTLFAIVIWITSAQGTGPAPPWLLPEGTTVDGCNSVAQFVMQNPDSVSYYSKTYGIEVHKVDAFCRPLDVSLLGVEV